MVETMPRFTGSRCGTNVTRTGLPNRSVSVCSDVYKRQTFEDGDKRGEFYEFFNEQNWPKTKAVSYTHLSPNVSSNGTLSSGQCTWYRSM